MVLDNKLIIHFGEDKTTLILFTTKYKKKSTNELNITYKNVSIKQYSKVTYLGCILDEHLSGESMALKVLNKINTRLKFLYRKNNYLSSALRRLLCNALIQPHFDYACTAWYTTLNKRLKNKLQVAQNKCIRFCLQLDQRTHIGMDEFTKIKWLPVEERFNQCLSASAYKFINGSCPLYMHDVYKESGQNKINTRGSFMKLKQTFRKTNFGQKCLSYLGPVIWNNLPDDIKAVKNINSFKHKFKDHLFLQM